METVAILKVVAIRIVLYGTVLFVVFAWIFSGLLLRAYRPNAWATPNIFNIKYEDIMLKTSDNIEVPVWWIKGSAHAGKVIILCHGLGADRTDMLNYIPFLTRAGYGIVVLDFRGHGKSTYKYTSLGFNETKDLLAAVKFAREKGAEKIGVIGRSMGGATCLRTAEMTDDINAVVSDSSFATLDSMIKHYASKFYHIPYYPMVPVAKFLAEKRSGFKYGEVNPAKSISKVKTPVLIIHGEADNNIPVSNAKLIFEVAGAPLGKKKLLTFPGADHVESLSKDTKRYEKETLDFLKENLK